MDTFPPGNENEDRSIMQSMSFFARNTPIKVVRRPMSSWRYCRKDHWEMAAAEK